ncbi:hypothetical protein [Streptomyces sp. NBC_01244]|uniref:hypothetical protein n=1 Tax=Streptomyces sp. NBC_01244 TaxID=2903797 RepID=UPI002E1039D7
MGRFSSPSFFSWVKRVSRRTEAIWSCGYADVDVGCLPDAQGAVGQDVRPRDGGGVQPRDGGGVQPENEQDRVHVHDQQDGVDDRPVGEQVGQGDGLDDAREREAVHHDRLVAAV